MDTNIRKIILRTTIVLLFLISGCGEDKSSINYPGTIESSYSFSGTVTANGSRLSGVSVELTGAKNLITFTNISGNYSFSNLQEGNYTIKPTMNGYAFNPVLFATSSLASRSKSYDFTATAN